MQNKSTQHKLDVGINHIMCLAFLFHTYFTNFAVYHIKMNDSNNVNEQYSRPIQSRYNQNCEKGN